MIRTKEEIIKIISDAYNDDSYMLVGEQLIGRSDFPNDLFKRYSDATGGELPAILGIDLARYGMDLVRVGEGTERWCQFRDQIIDFAEKGGIVTASSHWDNPSFEDPSECGYCRGMFGDGTEKYWDMLLTEGSEINKRFKAELILEGNFLKELGDRGVVVLWRPMHEGNGNWFWFTAKSSGQCPEWINPDYMKRLWRYIYDLYVNKMGMKNLLWVYSPANGINYTRTDPLYYYPGDDVVDIVGVDWYTQGQKEIFDPSHQTYEKLMGLGKPCVLAEFGPGGDLQIKGQGVEAQEKVFNSLDFLNLMKSLTVDNNMKCAYVLTWHHGYGGVASLGKAKEAFLDPFFCTLDRLNKRVGH